jgi:hypothetical protein
MYNIVDRVMLSAKPISSLSQTELRNKILGYLELLSSAGKRDPEELAALGAEYLRKVWTARTRVLPAADLLRQNPNDLLMSRNIAKAASVYVP